MPRTRTLPKRYNISETRFRELYYYTLQYQEWLEELKSGSLSPYRKEELRRRIAQIDITCYEANPELASYIRRGVTQKGMTYLALRNRHEIPCDRNTYYKYRRKFYWLLDKKKNET